MRPILVLLIALVGVGTALAQTPAPTGSSGVTITLVTGSDGTDGNLTFTLSGTFQGDPVVLPLDQPGDLQPGVTNVYSFSVPYDFCQLYQFQLGLDGDDWLGERMTINVNGIDVWFNGRMGDSGALMAGNTRGGTWDGTDAYRAYCPTLPVEVRFVTGDNGTADDIFFYLTGDFSASPYLFYFSQPGDLQPGQTDTYSYRVPVDFCQMTGWRLDKAVVGAADDDWTATNISIRLDATEVFFDGAFADLAPIVSGANIRGTWDGTAAYQTRCPFGSTPPLLGEPPLLATPEVIVLDGVPPEIIEPATQLQEVLPTIVVEQPQGTPEVFDEANPNAGVSQCQGAPPPRLEIGSLGRVTPGAPNRLRSQPSTSGGILGQMPAGSIFNVVGGFSCGEGYTWWQVNFNGIVGWTVEGTGSTYYLEPV